jgi:hypothetical protein
MQQAARTVKPTMVEDADAAPRTLLISELPLPQRHSSAEMPLDPMVEPPG